MAPLSFIQNPGLRIILMIAIILNLLLGAFTLYRQLSLGDAMATSQLNIVQKIAEVKNDVGNMKTDVHRELDSFTKEGQKRLQTNSDNSALALLASFAAQNASEDAAADVEKLRKELLERMKVVEQKSTVATRATLATHAKVSQKIITGPEAEALKRAAKKKTTVYKIWPWQ